MSRVLCNVHRNIALEYVRGEQHVGYIWLDGASVTIGKMAKREFDTEFYIPAKTREREHTPRDLCRHYLNLSHYPIDEGAAAIMVDIMALDDTEPRPTRTVLLCDAASGRFVGAYESARDAMLVQRHISGAQVIARPGDLAGWKEAQLNALRAQVAPDLKTRSKTKLIEGIFEMATKAKKPAAPAVKKVEKIAKERKARADGPVAIIRNYVQDNAANFNSGKLTRADARAYLLSKGLEKGTIGVQLPKWITAFKIKAEKGSPLRAKKTDGAAKSAKTPAKAAAKSAKTTPKTTAGKKAAAKKSGNGGKKAASKKTSSKKSATPTPPPSTSTKVDMSPLGIGQG